MENVLLLYGVCRVCNKGFSGQAEFDNAGDIIPDCEFAGASKTHESINHGHNGADAYIDNARKHWVGVVVSASETKTFFSGILQREIER